LYSLYLQKTTLPGGRASAASRLSVKTYTNFMAFEKKYWNSMFT